MFRDFLVENNLYGLINYNIMNLRPFIAFAMIPISVLLSVSISITDLFGPPARDTSNLPSQKSLFSNNGEVLLSQYGNIDINKTKSTAEQYAYNQPNIHDLSKLDYNLSLSDPKIGSFTFLTVICIGNSRNDCNYQNAFITTYDFGNTWEIGLL